MQYFCYLLRCLIFILFRKSLFRRVSVARREQQQADKKIFDSSFHFISFFCLNQDFQDFRIYKITVIHPVNPLILKILIQTIVAFLRVRLPRACGIGRTQNSFSFCRRQKFVVSYY